MIDEKGRLFGKINIVDLIVILVIVIAAVVVGMKFLGGGNGNSAINPNKTPVRYTVLVEGVEPEVYENIQKYIPGQLMASGELLGRLCHRRDAGGGPCAYRHCEHRRRHTGDPCE